MKRKLLVSIDVERDIVRYLSESYIGIEEGMPALLEVIRDSGYTPDLFVESAIANRYPDLVRKAERSGCLIACHGSHTDPAVATDLKRDQLKTKLIEGIDAIRRSVGKPPMAYREANFAVNSRTLTLLIELGFKADSSVLPGRLVRSHGIMPLVDHREAPDVPYRPGLADHRIAGTGAILEIPVTNNPQNVGAPIGTGFLNWKGIDQTLRAMRTSAGNPVTFLIHPWECVNLQETLQELPEWVTGISRENTRELSELLTQAREWFVASTLTEVADEFGVSLR